MNFAERFITILEQESPEDQSLPAHDSLLDADRSQDQAAMGNTLDAGTNPGDYNVPHPASKADEQKYIQIEELKSWIKTIDDFIEFLNAPQDGSMQVRLHTAGCDTLFDDIARSEKKKIARLAAELSGLSESLKGYLISAHA